LIRKRREAQSHPLPKRYADGEELSALLLIIFELRADVIAEREPIAERAHLSGLVEDQLGSRGPRAQSVDRWRREQSMSAAAGAEYREERAPRE
jgi:hypothetical protein